MFLVLTEQDLAKLSPELRAELQTLVFSVAGRDAEIHLPDMVGAPEMPNEDVERDYLSAWPDAFENSGVAKTVVDLDEGDARALLGNLSARSIDTLKLFAPGESVRLDSLVGEGKGYETLSDLKRSFVGAVNRRLRTVTRNRSAVLFRKVEEGDDLRIAIRPKAAAALREAFRSVTPTPISPDR